MLTFCQLTSCFAIVLPLLLCSSHFACADIFSYGVFNESNIILLKDASIHSQRVVTLTNQTRHSIGRVLYPNPIKIKASNNSILPFSTTFVMYIGVPSKGKGGNGMVFIMAPNNSVVGAQDSQYLGIASPKTNGLQSNHFLAVEFDTAYDHDVGDIDDNHIGVNVNGVRSFESQPAAYWLDDDHFNNFSLKSGENKQVWIDYDHEEDRLNVSVAMYGMEKPIRPLISVKKFNLSAVLKEDVYVGFSASTGFQAIEDHHILGWSFSTEGKAPTLDLSDLPSLIRKERTTKSRGFAAGVTAASLVVFFVAVFFALIKVKEIINRDLIEEWELEFWPHRIPHEELKAATQNFNNDQLVGCGGFGRVYKGVLGRSGLEVAVKCITKDSTAGMKEFVSEISSVGRLQHRNLIQLRGWCRKSKQLFIVYDYMPNGSLDKLIFPDPESKAEVLPSERRYAILKGIAAGLLYLHEQWERRVVHRDVKSSNVLLDSELNAKLGDFGLSRLYDHTQNPQTTQVVGTVGYIAPEVTNTGKVTPSSDVFSFGVVLLEVACGRRPVDLAKDSEQIVLLDWVKDLYQNGKILHAADPNLNGVYDVEEMERVLKLGLFCSHPQPVKRPGIGTVLQILEGQAPFPGHEALPISYDASYMDYGSAVVHITDEESTANQMISIPATTSTSQGYEIDSDYGLGR
ncbi:L-type lectin-domain containing receptor kinase IV.1-like [Cryptomeria japonica]|uniref:L-type lectin-domain containing receptor kinase IV.1-like n=1 Tax=Cryptomeria japonica TaxID=3369 RepID=UPI0027DA5D97|nr:L-type lectin-domain containing receptor kinase IV.1-like [Cryptomeria japonica]